MVLKQQSEQQLTPPVVPQTGGSEQWQFATLVEHSADLIAITSLQGQIQFLNTAGQRLLGLDSAEAALDTASADYMPLDSLPLFMQRVLPAVQEVGAWVGELWVRNIRTGEHIPVLANMFVLRDPASGQPASYATVMRDLRERKRKQERQQLLAQVGAELGSTLDYGTMLHSLTAAAIHSFAHWCAIVLVDDRGRMSELVLAHADSAQKADLRAALLDWPFERTALWNGTQSHAETLFLPDLAAVSHGDSVWERVRQLGGPSLVSTPLKLREQLMGVLVFASPPGRYYTTEDRQLVEQIGGRAAIALDHAQLYYDTQTAVSIRDQFISIASHELRTPLTSILGNLQLFQRRLERANTLNAHDKRTLQTVIDQTLRLNRLIGGLLDISRLQQGQLTLDWQMVDIGMLIQQTVEEMQPTLARQTMSFDLPPETLHIEGDQLRLEQVLQNLLQNAVKYSPNGGAITVLVEQPGENVLLTVSDQGIGIPRESLPYLFERFYRAPNAEAQRVSGMGIGLFVVREIVAMHGGTVFVESASGSGSTFTVSLPVKRKREEMDQVEETEKGEAGSAE